MSKAIVAIMAGLLCTLAGVKHASSIKADAGRLVRWTQVLEHLTLLLKEGIMSIPEALCAAADRQDLPDRLLQEMVGKMSAAPLMTPADAYDQCSFECPETDALSRMFGRLGHGTKESRCLAVTQAAEEIRLLAQYASTKADKDARLWQTLGFVGGACLTIMLL